MILHYGWPSDPALWITWPGIQKHKTQSYDLVVVEPLKNDDLGMIKRFLHITILMLWSYIKMKLYDYDAFIWHGHMAQNRRKVIFHGKRAWPIISLPSQCWRPGSLAVFPWLGRGSFQDWIERRRKRPVGLKAWFNKEMNESSPRLIAAWIDVQSALTGHKNALSLSPSVGMNRPPNWITIDRSVLDWTNKMEKSYVHSQPLCMWPGKEKTAESLASHYSGNFQNKLWKLDRCDSPP